MQSLDEMSLMIIPTGNDEKAERLIVMWNSLKDDFRNSLEKDTMAYLDISTRGIARFLYTNEKHLIGKGFLTADSYDAILELLDLILEFIWNPDNRTKDNRTKVSKENKEKLFSAIEVIRKRIDIPRIEE
jgi:hypothetical protein